jgi:Dimerisation and cyclophilin-binding domain of Mon2
VLLSSAQAQAVELLCRCDDIADDGVELRVLKGLLTAVTSNTLHVHGQALLLVSLQRQCIPCVRLSS